MTLKVQLIIVSSVENLGVIKSCGLDVPLAACGSTAFAVAKIVQKDTFVIIAKRVKL